jgi:ABC-type Fe2+-enterobactin transport system substrate-binding protein
MGFAAARRGQVTVQILGPKTPGQEKQFKQQFDRFKQDMRKVLSKYPLVKGKVIRVTYEKKKTGQAFR